MTHRIGLIVNPIAGMGGRVGLKGTDGPDILREARARGAEPVAPNRARQAMTALARLKAMPQIVTLGGAMGEDVARAAGIAPTVLANPATPETTAADTVHAATLLAGEECDLILFAGGDGTARDVFGAVERSVPMLGIPTGVKMHSGVFAVGPASAGRLAADYVGGAGTPIDLRDGEIMDIDEAAQRDNRLSARLFGYARVPHERQMLQSAKSAGRRDEDAVLDALAAELAGEMQPGTTYVIGPGTTAKRVLSHLDLEGSLLGVDVVRDRRLLAVDAPERTILALCENTPTIIVTGVIGGQGFVFGRGNQQISAAVIAGAGPDNIVIMAGEAKLTALAENRLLVDTGEAEIDALLAGYRRVRTAPGRSTVMRLVAA